MAPMSHSFLIPDKSCFLSVCLRLGTKERSEQSKSSRDDECQMVSRDLEWEMTMGDSLPWKAHDQQGKLPSEISYPLQYIVLLFVSWITKSQWLFLELWTLDLAQTLCCIPLLSLRSWCHVYRPDKKLWRHSLPLQSHLYIQAIHL